MLVRAAKRGVRLSIIIETPDKIEGEDEYSTIKALGQEVAACSHRLLLAEGESPSR